jgi:hypothetical protein
MEKKMTSKACHNSVISAILPHMLLSVTFPLGLLLLSEEIMLNITQAQHSAAQFSRWQ